MKKPDIYRRRFVEAMTDIAFRKDCKMQERRSESYSEPNQNKKLVTESPDQNKEAVTENQNTVSEALDQNIGKEQYKEEAKSGHQNNGKGVEIHDQNEGSGSVYQSEADKSEEKNQKSMPIFGNFGKFDDEKGASGSKVAKNRDRKGKIRNGLRELRRKISAKSERRKESGKIGCFCCARKGPKNAIDRSQSAPADLEEVLEEK